jgi:peptide/nickel transport system substrate-binding protein
MATNQHPILGALGTWKRRGFLGLTPAALAAACGQAPAAQPGGNSQPTTQDQGKAQRGGTYTEAGIGDAKTMQPLLSQDTASSGFIALHFNAPFLRRDPDTMEFDAKYGTAESFQISPDGKTVSFKLKPNLMWSDGKPLTAQDYKFTWDKMMDPKVEYPYRSLYKDFEGMATPDDKTVVITLKEAFCPAIDNAIIEPLPKHVFEGLDLNDSPQNMKPTVGSGPWLMQEWVKDSHAVFTANDKFYLGRPNIDKYVVRIVTDQNVVWTMLKAGEVDSGTIKAEDWDEAKRVPHLATYNYYSPRSSWVFIGYNVRKDELKDVRVRQALAHAVDRQKIVDRIRLGHARPLNSIYPPASWAYVDDVAKYNYDPAKAKQLLDSAGWTVGPGGTRVKDGKPLKMRIFYNAGNKEREQIATVMQQSAKEVGVDLEVISEEWNAYLNRVNKTYDMEMFVLGWAASVDPNGMRNIWMSDGQQNSVGYSNAKVDEIYPKAAIVAGCKQDDRKKMYGDIQRQISADAPYIFLYESESLAGVHNRFVVNKLGKSGFGGVSYRMWEWYSKTGK